MLYRAPLAVSFSLSLLSFACVCQTQSSPATAQPHDNRGLQGTVLNADGKPAPGIHIELDQAGTAVPISSTDTERDGTFELYNIPSGAYELVAESNDSETSDPVTVNAGDSRLQLRLPRNAPPPQALTPVVSVAQMMVPESAQKYFRKAKAAYKQGKLDKARSLVDAALQIHPQFADALALRGMLDAADGNLAQAQDDYERAVQIDPACSTAYVGLGVVYNHQGRFDDAMRASQKGLSLSPKSWQAYFELSKSAIAKGMYAQGLQFARQAQRLSGNSFAAVHLIKAYALVPMRLYKDARYELQAFLSHEPKGNGSAEAQTLLATVDAALVPQHP